MSDSYIQKLFAERIGGARYGKDTAPYKFAKIKQAKAEAVKRNPDIPIIDLGVGEPDEMAYPQVVKTLQAEAARPENRGYADNGGPEFRAAAAEYMKKVFGVRDLDPETEIVHSIGSKTALSLLPAAFVDPGDAVIMTVPGYPVLGTHAQYYGGNVFNVELTEENDFLPNLGSIPRDVLEKAKILVLNYPNNPTGACATEDFFRRAVRFARENNLILVQDAAYAALVFEGKPLSILAVPGARDVAVELHSLSKSHNMTGWRLGFVCGNPRIVKAYGDIKNNSDSGQFLAIQKAGVAALKDPSITGEITRKYSRRMDLLVKALNGAGFRAAKPGGTFFLYARAPRAATRKGKTTRFDSAEAFSQWLIGEQLISTVPWDEAGPYVRFSVTFEAMGEKEEKRIAEEIGRRLEPYTFEF